MAENVHPAPGSAPATPPAGGTPAPAGGTPNPNPAPAPAPAPAAGASAPAAGSSPAPAAPAPVTYELKLPEKSPLDAAVVERVAGIAQDLKLADTPAAQKVLDFVHHEVADRLQAVIASHQPPAEDGTGGEEWKRINTEWTEAAKKDPEIAGKDGSRFDANIELAKRVAATFFPDEVHAFLHSTGFGSHPAIIRGFLKIAEAMKEDSFVPAGGGPPPSKAKTAAEIMYPSMKKED